MTSSTDVTLPGIIEMIHPKDISFWALQSIEAASRYFFDLSLEEFEHLTDSAERGLVVSNESFILFLDNLIDFYNGTVIAIHANKSRALFILEYFDSSEWIIETNDTLIAKELSRFNWIESTIAPQRRCYSLYNDVCDASGNANNPVPL